MFVNPNIHKVKQHQTHKARYMPMANVMPLYCFILWNKELYQAHHTKCYAVKPNVLLPFIQYI